MLLDVNEFTSFIQVEWTQQLVAQQKQRTQKILKETERIQAVADADRLKDVQAIDIAKHIEQEEGKANISSIRNEIMARKRVRIFHSFFMVFNNIKKKI